MMVSYDSDHSSVVMNYVKTDFIILCNIVGAFQWQEFVVDWDSQCIAGKFKLQDTTSVLNSLCSVSLIG